MIQSLYVNERKSFQKTRSFRSLEEEAFTTYSQTFVSDGKC